MTGRGSLEATPVLPAAGMETEYDLEAYERLTGRRLD
jgi:hypothetical protein